MARDADNGLTSRISISETSDESPETLEQPDAATNRRETLYQKANEDESPALTKAEFQDLLEHPETLYKEIVELVTKARDLRAYGENYHEQLQETKRALHKSETILDKLVAQPSGHLPDGSPAPEHARRTVKLPDPPLFDGSSKDVTTFDNWLIQLKNKLRGNADSYPTEELKIIYAAGRTSGEALALISPRLNATSSHAYTALTELYEHLEELYGDPNKERNARQAFKSLVMKKGQTFQEFYAAFLRNVADGNISPQDLKDDLNDKLTWKLQESVATYYNDPTVSMSQFARYCTTNDQQIRNRFEKRDQASRKAEDSNKTSSKQTSRPRTATSPTSTDRQISQKSGGTDLKCYNCFELGHISRDCPKPKTERTKQILAAKLATVTTELPQAPEDSKNE